MCKFPAYNDRLRSWFNLKERSARNWKVRSTKVDAGDFKHELLNRLRSTMAVNVLIICQVFFLSSVKLCIIGLWRIVVSWVICVNVVSKIAAYTNFMKGFDVTTLKKSMYICLYVPLWTHLMWKTYSFLQCLEKHNSDTWTGQKGTLWRIYIWQGCIYKYNFIKK